MCKHFNVKPQKGDVLLIRMGVIPEWDAFTTIQKEEYAAQKEPEHAGVEACTEVLEWLWDSGFAAVGGDAISWEVSLAIQTSGERHGYLCTSESESERPAPAVPCRLLTYGILGWNEV